MSFIQKITFRKNDPKSTPRPGTVELDYDSITGAMVVRDENDVETPLGGTSTLTATLNPTVSIGGIAVGETQAAGTNLEAVLREMLSPYVSPAFTSFSLSPSPTTREVGASYTPSSASYGYNLDSAGDPPQNMVITGTGFSGAVTGTSAAASGAIANRTGSAGSANWVLSGENANGDAIATRTVSLSWQYRWKFGAASTLVTNIATAQTVYDLLQQSALRSNQAHTVAATADNNNGANYTYIAYAATYPNLSQITLNGATPVLTAFTNLGSFQITTATGEVVQYKFYRSNSPGAFGASDSLNIS